VGDAAGEFSDRIQLLGLLQQPFGVAGAVMS